MSGNVGRGFEFGYGAYFGRAAARATVFCVATLLSAPPKVRWAPIEDPLSRNWRVAIAVAVLLVFTLLSGAGNR